MNAQDSVEFCKGVLSISEVVNTAFHLEKLSKNMGIEKKPYLIEASKDTHTINDINVNFELPIIYNYEIVSDLIDSYLISIGKVYSNFKEPIIQKFIIDIKTNDKYTCYLLNIQISIALPKNDSLKSIYQSQERLHLY